MDQKRILIVDDSKTQLAMLKMALEKDNFEIITAVDGLEGVSRTYMNRPDLIVSDIEMPELNGYQLCRLLKNDKDTAKIPIILLTSLNQPQDLFWGIRAGANRYIVKSNDFSALKKTIKQQLEECKNFPSTQKPTAPLKGKVMDWKSIRYSLNHLLDKLLFESTLSNEARRLANYIHNSHELMLEIAILIASLIDYCCLCICLFEGKKIKLYFDIRQPLVEAEIKKIKEEQLTLAEKERQINTPQETNEESIDTYYLKNTINFDALAKCSITDKLIFPLNIHNECIGNLSLYSTSQEGLSQKSEDIINLLTGDFSMILKLMLLHEEIRNISITDALTGLNNNRYFKEMFHKEFDRAKRFNNNLSLIFIDIDHFKSINDKYGHLQGDSVLKEIGLILANSLRDVDFAARYGGEEFAILAFEADIGSTSQLADRIRKTVENHSFKAEKEPLKLTISVGVATLTSDNNDMLDIIKKADEALYEAKESGRNKVCIAK